MPDDWELDDWDEDGFDEDVWDAHAEDLEAADDPGEDTEEFGEVLGGGWSGLHALGELDTLDDVEVTGGGDGVALGRGAAGGSGGTGMAWSAWDIGTVFALGGWLADHHAQDTARQVAAALAAQGHLRPAPDQPRGAPHPPPPSGHPYRQARGTLAVGGSLEAGALYAELVAADAARSDLLVDARGPAGVDRQLVLLISAVPSSRGPRFWVVAEEHPTGFSASRLIPVFGRESVVGAAIFGTDHAHEAVDAAIWAVGREGLHLGDFHLVEKRARSTR